jgi:hypothetical protein
MPYADSATLYGPRQDLVGALYSTAPSQKYAALDILPPMPVYAKDGRYHKVSSGKAYRLVGAKRAPGAPYARVATPIDSATFLCEERGIEESVDRAEKAIYRSVLDQDQVAATTAYNVLSIAHESDVAAAIFNETTFPASGTTGLTVSTAWSNASSSTPIADLNAGKNAISAKVGDGSYVLLANDRVVRNLWASSNVRNQIKDVYGRYIEGNPNLETLAAVLGVNRIIEAPAIYNTAVAGATPSMSRIWSDTYAFLARVSNERMLREPQLGRTFVLNNVLDRSDAAALDVGAQLDDRLLVEMYRDDTRRSDVVRCIEYTDEVIMDSSCGFLFKSVT